MPHAGLAQYKKDQNWVKKQGEKLIFPGGGTQFKHGAGHYIDWVQSVRASVLIKSSSLCIHSCLLVRISDVLTFVFRYTLLLGGANIHEFC